MFEEQFFLRRKVNPEKLPEYGFTAEDDGYIYKTAILRGELQLSVFIMPDGSVSTQVADVETGEEYTLYRVAASVGAYVGEVRGECERVLRDIAQNCFEPDVYHAEQTLALIRYVRERFGDELEFLWETSPTSSIWRRKDNRKWYGLLMTLPRRKLGLDSDETAEILDLRLDPAQMAETVDRKRYFPGWHMNKKSWYTMILDGSVPTEELFRRIGESYDLANK